ncbi:MAG: hypothetical protein A3K19_32180 [Lentisphaerae bacterium RIFOXYB12_FULL_65_16]|nr:MAG: hypothetical protein A3K18_12750 [Lentisphaerae bacterium RIFOXYA12_64_32]OGV88759.1 MAG: hypothetical protein A3K19_32180 [Lentisphaerae bacterium RIFOXYB12_FULL_65_16]
MEMLQRQIPIRKPYLHLPVTPGAPKVQMTFAVDGATVRAFEIELAPAEPGFWCYAEVGEWQGKTLTVGAQLPTDSKALEAVTPSEELPGAAAMYQETYRPQFHFASRRGWLNDPNGLVYYKGQWHLFYQHNPYGTGWGNMHWGHAVSPDLFHWRELGEALYPDRLGPMFSGGAVVDHDNTAGFQAGPEKALVAFYTAAGSPATQCLAYSNDGGLTLTKYAKNPILPHVPEDIAANRDPKVIWHAPTHRWIMALYVGIKDGDKKDAKGHPAKLDMVYFFSSPDLKQWTYESRIPGFYECPDIFEAPVADRAGESRWVLYGADGRYATGRFDGKTFTPDGEKRQVWYGRFYAAQTYDNAPDGRRVQIGWAQGVGFHGMPFSQQMNVPVELTLRQTAEDGRVQGGQTEEGPRLFAWPVRELDALRCRTQSAADIALQPGIAAVGVPGGAERMDIVAEFAVGAAAKLGLTVRGTPVVWDAAKRELTCGNVTAPLAAENGTLRLRILVDRGSIEVFGNTGRVALSTAVLHAPKDLTLAPLVDGGNATLTRIDVHELRSAWR